jgi:hypothetical protein
LSGRRSVAIRRALSARDYQGRAPMSSSPASVETCTSATVTPRQQPGVLLLWGRLATTAHRNKRNTALASVAHRQPFATPCTEHSSARTTYGTDSCAAGRGLGDWTVKHSSQMGKRQTW